ncbi:MAG: ABC transporter permease subunit, partial [Bacteroidota bacterium]
MSPVWVIAKRELGSYFDSLIAYIILIAFLGFSGFFTWLYGADVFLRKQADMAVFFGVARWTLFFFIPALTMRQLAEEKRAGTIELLLTKAVSSQQVVVGKFLSCLLMVAIALAFT